MSGAVEGVCANDGLAAASDEVPSVPAPEVSSCVSGCVVVALALWEPSVDDRPPQWVRAEPAAEFGFAGSEGALLAGALPGPAEAPVSVPGSEWPTDPPRAPAPPESAHATP